jgi:FdhD protein
MEPANKNIQYHRFSANQLELIDTQITIEKPVSLTVNSEAWLTFMCTPIDLDSLAIGFLYNESLIKSKDEIEDVRICAKGDNVDVWLSRNISQPENWRRTSGCTGGITSVSGRKQVNDVLNGGTLSAEKVGYLVNKLFESQQLYRISGGIHTSVLSDGEEIIISAEDIGRHNTLDKIAGKLLSNNFVHSRHILITTGRISSEMIQKASRIGASIVISRTSPSSLSIDLAEKWGITLIGYARRDRFNLYTHPERIVDQQINKLSVHHQ